LRKKREMSRLVKPYLRDAPDDFRRRWEIRFDAALKNEGAQEAWQKLTAEEGCDPNALKSALYYAAYCLEGAQDAPQAWENYSRVRGTLFMQSSELKKTLRELMWLSVAGERLVSGLITFHGLNKQYVAFLRKFPKLLDRFENVLRILSMPPQQRHQTRALLTAAGEALLHIYVKENTGSSYGADAALLLKAGAVSYGLELCAPHGGLG
jgi:hypothetical protein